MDNARGANERPVSGEPSKRSKTRSISWRTIAVRALDISPTWGVAMRDPRRKGLHDAVRRRYKVIVDRPEVIIADLVDSGMHWNAN